MKKTTKPNQTKRGFVLQMFWVGWFSKNKREECNTQAHKARFFKRTLSLHGKSQRFILLWLVQFDWHNKMILQVKTAFCFTKWKSCLIKMSRESWRSEQWVIFLRQSHIRETFKESSSYSWTFERRGKKKEKSQKWKLAENKHQLSVWFWSYCAFCSVSLRWVIIAHYSKRQSSREVLRKKLIATG